MAVGLNRAAGSGSVLKIPSRCDLVVSAPVERETDADGCPRMDQWLLELVFDYRKTLLMPWAVIVA